MACRGWRHWGTGLTACFVVGCLFRPTLDPAQPPALLDLGKADVASTPVGEAPQPPILSTYHVQPVSPVARLSGSVEPSLERVRLDVTPATLPALERKPERPPEPPIKESPFVAAVRRAIEKHPQQAQAILNRSGATDRQVLLALFRLTVGIHEDEIAKLPPQEIDATLEQLSALIQSLRQRAALALDKVCFCSKIENFGQYDPLPSDHKFQGGSEGRPGERVQVYAEVRNFTSTLRDGRYETVLNSSLEIHDTQRRRVVTMNLGTCTDRSQTPRQDYFLNFQFHVPSRLPPGLYTLWVIVKDMTPSGTGKTTVRLARRSLDFKVRAPGERRRAEPAQGTAGMR